MQDNESPTAPAPDLEETGTGRQVAEFIFILLVGAVGIAALLAALSYALVSARAPLTILVPLLILVAIQLNRTRKVVRMQDIRLELRRVFTGGRKRFVAIAALTGWMALLLGAIFVLGHYAGMFVFLLILLRGVAGESWGMTLLVSVLVTGSVYLLFEHVFNLELYRGLLLNLVESALA